MTLIFISLSISVPPRNLAQPFYRLAAGLRATGLQAT